MISSACAGGIASLGGSSQPAAPFTVQVVTAEKANIVQTLTYSGDVKATSAVNILPKQPGALVSIPVGVGSIVKQGDLIAQLDHTSLDISLEQAQAALQAAQSKVSTIQAGPRDENVRQAQLAVDNAQQKLQNMLNGTRPEQTAQAQAAVDAAKARLDALQHPRSETVAQAQLQVGQAQQRLDALLHPRPENVAQALLQVNQAQQKLDALTHPRAQTIAQAQLGVDQAKQKLGTIQAGPRPEIVQQAQAGLSQAQAALQALKNGPSDTDIHPLRIAVDQAKNALLAAQLNRDGACNNIGKVIGPGAFGSQPLCDAANAQVNAAQSGVDGAVASLAKAQAPAKATDLQRAQAAVDQAQAALNQTQHPFTAQDLQQVQDAVQSAQQQLDLIQHPSPQDVQQAQNAVAIAQQQLALVQRPASSQDVQQAQNAVAIAQQQLALAQQPGSPQDVQQAGAGVTQAEQQLNLLLKPFTDQDIQQARNAVAAAQQQLALAKQPYTSQDLQAAQAGAAQAQAAVDAIKQSIKDATVTAPVDGVITQKSLDVGATASPATSIVTLSSSGVKVQIPVDGTQVGALKPGLIASVTPTSGTGQAIPAKVGTIAPSGDPQRKTFTVDVNPDQQSSQLLAGTSVQVQITVAEHRDVTAVPKAAVVQRAAKPYVFVVQNNVAKQVPVTVGLASDQLTEITNGLAVGANVIVQGQQDLNDGDRVAVSSIVSFLDRMRSN